jgi:Sulfatase-modifying factor enzyme 1
MVTLFLSAILSPMQSSPTFVVDFPEHMAKLTMVSVPDGKITIDGKTTVIKGMSFSQTEIPWDVFDIWALRLDTSVADQKKDPQSKGVDAVSRPSRPYGVMFTGFGHHGYPAMCMSSLNADMFCDWLSARTGKKFRVPTVAEWRYACNAGTDQNLAASDDTAWTWDNADDISHKIGTKPANAFGLKDMLGNVAEWAKDAEGKPVICGGSFRDKTAAISSLMVEPSSPKWNEADPQIPKSKWWLANGQHVGLRIICIQ